MDLLRTIKLVLTQYRAFQAALAELNSHSERELGELGIARADIPQLAYAEAERCAGALAPSRPALRQPFPRRASEAAAA